jgi:hypothetical protein
LLNITNNGIPNNTIMPRNKPVYENKLSGNENKGNKYNKNNNNNK